MRKSCRVRNRSQTRISLFLRQSVATDRHSRLEGKSFHPFDFFERQLMDRIHGSWSGKRRDVRFLDFWLSDLCVGQECSESATLFKRLFLSGYRQRECALFAMAAHSKVFIVVRNKGVVPKQRRVERLPSGYSVRESRDDSHGNYWYVVTALEVVRPRDA
jgi:hypothetical protein